MPPRGQPAGSPAVSSSAAPLAAQIPATVTATSLNAAAATPPADLLHIIQTQQAQMAAFQEALDAIAARQTNSDNFQRVDHQVRVLQTLTTKASPPDAQTVLSHMEVLADAARATGHPEMETYHTLLNDLKAREHLGGKALCVLFISYLGTDAQKKHQTTLLAFDKQALKLAAKDSTPKRPYHYNT